MELQLYDTLTRKKRAFEPLDRNNVRMYVCGPTVYDFAHIGNARPVIVFDVLFRLLRHLYGADHVTYVRNITDVDDKINARAAEEHPDLPLNEAIRRVTEKTERQFHEDVAALGCLPPTVEPRATEHIDEMKTLIERMIAHGCAYVASDHVLFDVKKMADYGALSKRSLDEMIAGARVEVAPYKRDPMDFVLWKPSKPGEPAWSSPAGIAQPGRPGWHIECSAMSWKHLGETFDIHGGGIDLVFPHHENEIAQSRCAFHSKVMANFWMHNGFLQVEGEKMSKSLGNFVTINELLHTSAFGGRTWSGFVLRLAMMRTHYRQPIDWTAENLRRSDECLHQWRAFAGERTTKSYDKEAFARFINLMADDLNTPGALNAIDEVVASREPTPEQRYFVYKALRLLGFMVPLSPTKRTANALARAIKSLEDLPDDYIRSIVVKARTNARYRTGKFRPEASLAFSLALLESLAASRNLLVHFSEDDVAEYARSIGARNSFKIRALIAARNSARARKDYIESDRIRDELAAMGVVLHDTKDGTTWEIAR
jgi:cysteinyl-tRNA synthetase